MMSMIDLPNCILVTGACGGVGLDLVQRFGALGISVIAVDRHSSPKNFPQVDYFKCDLVQEDQIRHLWATLKERHITVDCLINNAGIYTGTTWDSYQSQDIDTVMKVNLVAPFLMSQAFARQTNGGNIINISSVSAFCGSHDPLYGATKSGLIGLTKSLGLCLAPQIRVNAIAPGIIETPMKEIISDRTLQKYHDAELLEEALLPRAITDAVFYLMSSLSKNVTGTTIDVNNGVYLR